MFLRQNYFLYIVVSLFLLVGCKDKAGTPSATEEAAGLAETSAVTVPYPAPELLEKLGPENKLDTRWLLPDPIFILAGQPKKFLTSPLGAGNEALLSGAIEEFLNVPFAPVRMERFVQASSFPGQIQIEVEQNGVKVPQVQMISRRSLMLTFVEPIEKETILSSVFGLTKEDMESKKRQVGKVEYYDLSQPGFDAPQRPVAAVSFLDDRTLVVVEGFEADVKTVFEPAGEPVKSAAVARIKRLDLEANDVVLISSLEGMKIDPNMLSGVLLQSGVPQNFVDALVKHLRAVALSINMTAPVGEPMVTVRFDARDAQGATEIAETVQGLVLSGQTTLALMDDNARISLPVPADFAKSVLNSVTIKSEEAKVDIILSKFEGFEETAAGGIRNRQTAMQQMQLQQQRMNQMMMMGQIFMTYYQKNKKFPSDIRSADGTPLLSWRVSVLPMFDLQELYEKFKLDEPWNSPANKPLMEKMPQIFQSLTPDVEPLKTVICFFDSEGSPLANPNLQPEDLKNPQSTLLLVSVRPEKAVEWTKPEPLPFEIDKFEETIGSTLFGVTFAGQIVPDMPIIPLSDPRSAQQRKYLESLVKGLPLPAPPTEETPSESQPASPPSPPTETPVIPEAN